MKNEPAIIAVVAQVIAFLAARYGFELDAETTMTIAAGIGALGLVIVRQLVTPVAKLAAPEEGAQADE